MKPVLKIVFLLYWALVLGLCLYFQISRHGADAFSQNAIYGAALLVLAASLSVIGRQYRLHYQQQPD